MTTELWPPLALIRSTFERDARAAAAGDPVRPPGQHAEPAQRRHEELMLPLTELARRREAVARRAFPARWAPGRLVSVLHEGRLLGVLLDRCLHGELWQGYMAAGEADWAGAFDVLLEPDDEPFEPMFGLVQAWNVVTLQNTPQLCARVLGEVSATRLAAIRAVADEAAAQAPPATPPEPGRIALRSVGGVFSVLSGTPLAAAGDPRAEYQALYREAALQLGTALQPAAPRTQRTAAPAPAREDGWARIRSWFGGTGVLRPAVALLALVVVVQNAALLRGGDEDDVRFRSVPAAPMADAVLRWKPGVDMEAAGQLLRSVSAEVVGGPDARGGWRLRLVDPASARAVLAASPLVEAVDSP